MLQLENLKMKYGDHLLFEDVNLSLNPNSCYGVVGANGSGKSTLLKILAEKISPVEGQVNYPNSYRISFLDQKQFEYDEYKILDVVLMGKPKIWELIKYKRKLSNKNDISNQEGTKLAELSNRLSEMGGFNAETEAASILHGLGFASDQLSNKMKTLSGGYKLRVLLAQCLFSEPEVLLLDEPNNHLDIHSIAWLEKYLEDFKGIVVVVSHDHEFLNRISTHILDIDYQTIRLYKGNYEYFKEKKKKVRERKKKKIKKQEEKKEQMRKFIQKFKANAARARQAQSRKKQLENMEEINIKRSSRSSPTFIFNQAEKSGKKVLTLNDITKSFDGETVLNGIDLKVKRGDKIVILGPNGIGKTTLLKIMLGKLEKDQGEVEWGENVSIGYYAQNHKEQIDENKTAFQCLEDIFPKKSIGTIKKHLGRMLFQDRDMEKEIKALSGGETARLMFARLMLKETNVLVLDEPTNHLDLESIEALADTLNDYPGTVICVSHDRFFVDKLADSILELTPAGPNHFMGPYSLFMNTKEEDYLNANIKNKEDASREEKGKVGEKKKEFVNKRRKIKKKHSRIENKISTLEQNIAEIEEKIDEIEANLFSGNKNKSFEKLDELSQEKDRLEGELMELMEEWENRQAEYENLEEKLNHYDQKIAEYS